MRKITTLNVRNRSSAAVANAAFLIPHFFKKGEVKMVDGKPEPIAIGGKFAQVDQWVTHPHDRQSVAMALLSGTADLAPSERKGLDIAVLQGDRIDLPAPFDIENRKRQYSGQVTANIFHPKKIEIYFGDRDFKARPSTPFLEGEQITITLTNSKGESECATATINSKYLKAGWFPEGVGVMWEVVNAINTTNSYRAAAAWEERLQVTTLDPDGGDFTIDIKSTGKAPVRQYPVQDYWEAARYVAIPDLQIAQVRLAGPVIHELIAAAPLVSKKDGQKHPHLNIIFCIRFTEAGTETQFIVENNNSYVADPGNQTYAVEFAIAGRKVYELETFTQNHHSSFIYRHRQGGLPDLYVRQDMQYMQDTGFMFNFDQGITVSPKRKYEARQKIEARAKGTPLLNYGITAAMPGTGGRDDIGAQPRWVSDAQVDEDEDLDAAMLVMADTAGIFPMQHKDHTTGEVLNLDKYWGATLDAGFAKIGHALPAMKNSTTGLDPDDSHMPSPSFYAYIRTGDYFYLRNAQFWCNYWALARIPETRQFEKVIPTGGQPRAMAWNLRSIAEVCAITPDCHPMNGYFNDRLARMLKDYAYNPGWVMTKDNAPLHNIDGPTPAAGLTRPWMQDFWAFALGGLAFLGYKDAQKIVDYMDDFIAGRWLDPVYAAFGVSHQGLGYTFDAWNYDAKNPKIHQNWTEVKQFMFPGIEPTDVDFREKIPANQVYPGGYTGIAVGATGALADVSPLARQAFDLLEFKIAPDLKRAFADETNYAVIPRGYSRPASVSTIGAPPPPPAPPGPPPVLVEGMRIAENASFTLTKPDFVYYGIAGTFFKKLLGAGTHKADNLTFDDPIKGTVKFAWVIDADDVEVNPPPAPAPAPVEAPATSPAPEPAPTPAPAPVEDPPAPTPAPADPPAPAPAPVEDPAPTSAPAPHKDPMLVLAEVLEEAAARLRKEALQQ